MQVTLQRCKVLEPQTKSADTNVITFETEIRENIDWPPDKGVGDEAKIANLDEKSRTNWSEFGGHSNGGFQSHLEDDKNKDNDNLENLNDPIKSQLSELHMVVVASNHGDNFEELDCIENSSSEANRAAGTEAPKDKVN